MSKEFLYHQTHRSQKVSNLKLSKQGKNLIKLYERMVIEGYERQDGSKVENTYNDFEQNNLELFVKNTFHTLVPKQF